MKLRLHNYWRSSASYRVRIGLGLAQLPYEYVAVNIIKDGGEQNTEAYRAKNPMAQVPTLEVVRDDVPAVFLTQSLPILEFLVDALSAPLLPADPFARANARALAEIINSGIQPLQNLTTTRKVKALGGDDGAWVREYIETGLRAFAQALPAGAGPYCLGRTPGLADCCLVPQLYSARRFSASLAGLERLVDIDAACTALPAFANAHPDRQPDAIPA